MTTLWIFAHLNVVFFLPANLETPSGGHWLSEAALWTGWVGISVVMHHPSNSTNLDEYMLIVISEVHRGELRTLCDCLGCPERLTEFVPVNKLKNS